LTTVILKLGTTGLDPERHHIWEIGAIVRGHRDADYDGEWHWMLRPALGWAEPMALRVGRFYERAGAKFAHSNAEAFRLAAPEMFNDMGEEPIRQTRRQAANDLAMMLDGAHLVGRGPSVDAAFLGRFLRAHGHAPTWDSHLVDVEQLAVGYLAGARAGYNDSVAWLADYHAGNTEAGDTCHVTMPDLDRTPIPGPPWSSHDTSLALGVKPPSPDQRHTALGDARWAAAIYDRVLGVAA
jgi:hypothetical protein